MKWPCNTYVGFLVHTNGICFLTPHSLAARVRALLCWLLQLLLCVPCCSLHLPGYYNGASCNGYWCPLPWWAWLIITVVILIVSLGVGFGVSYCMKQRRMKQQAEYEMYAAQQQQYAEQYAQQGYPPPTYGYPVPPPGAVPQPAAPAPAAPAAPAPTPGAAPH